ncbi:MULTISPECIES: hypothetical protein [Nocardiopsis]|uniref:Uncharacterized protein n=1 Tax=Nocardiopsis sinuspersici TaxID=501010 RepID=A0A7Y9XDU3_9ACTN|nr:MULTISPECIES: hypothetical protein [Nocardiopsis]NYH53991.1 hypothetical protein [Nocardiopsis sinuspersici]
MTYQGPEHRAARRTVAVVTYVLTVALTAAAVVALVWLGMAAVQGVWAYALARIAEGS